jgi:hypothetical protein
VDDNDIFDELVELRQASLLDQATVCRLANAILTSRAETHFAAIANYVCGQALLYFADQLDGYQQGESTGSNFAHVFDLIANILRSADYQQAEVALSQLVELTRASPAQH